MTETAAYFTQASGTAARKTTLSTLRGQLRVGTALAGMILPLGIPGLALAADECGTPLGGVVTCSAAGNPYATGISYGTAGSDLTVILSADTVVQAAIGSKGIAVTGSAGKVTIDSAGRVETVDDNSNAVSAKSDMDAVTVTNSGVISTAGMDSYGVNAISLDGVVSVRNEGSVTTAGDNSRAIFADSSTNDVSVTNTGTLATTGANAQTIFALGDQGDVVVSNSGDISATGDGSAAIVAGTTHGDVTVTSTGTVTSVDDTAVSAASTTGNVTIDVASATAGGGGRAISGSSVDGNVDVKVGSASTTSEEGSAVDIRNTNGNLTLEADTLTTLGGLSHGVLALGGIGLIDLKVNSIATHGDDSYAIKAMTTSGPIAIDVGSITTTGDWAEAVWANSTTGAITVNVRGDISTAGIFSNGVIVTTDGDVGITVNNISTIGEGSSAVTASSGSGKLTVVANGAITTKGKSSVGILAASDSGDIDVTAGNIDTYRDDGHGIEANSTTGKVKIVNNGTIAVRGENAHGIVAEGGGGTTVIADSVSVSGYRADGIVLSGNAGIDLKVRDLQVAGVGSDGIVVEADSGPVRIDADNVRITGDSGDGIIAHVDSGPVEVNVGNVHVRDGRAISAETRGGDTAVRIAGKVQGFAEEIVYAGSSGNTRIDILAGGEVSSFDGTRTAILASGTDVVIDNAGLVSATTVPTLISGDGTTRLNNSGTFIGSLVFGAGDDLVTNSGAFNLSGESDFWDGDDLFVNTGTVSVLDSATLANLERFENSGLVTMANNRAGDVLTMSGNYVGTNGRLVLDIDTAAATPNDTLVIGGAASGTTVIALNSLRGGALLPGRTLTLVNAAGGSPTGAFTLAPETIDAGFARYFMNHNGAADDFYISASEGRGLFQMLNVSEGAQALWRQSADVWSARTMAQRDPASAAHDRTPVWAQFYGSVEQRDQGFSASSGSFDISYRQRHAGGQVGVDLGEIGGVTYGLTGGYLASALKFAGTDDRTDYDAFSLGAYAQGEWDGYFVNALAKYDVLGAKIDSMTGGFTEKLDGKAYGLQVEAGARFGDAGFFIEPVASLAYSATDLDTLAALGATVDFARSDSLLGKAGARIGGAADIGSGIATFYLGAHVVNEFEGKGNVRFDTGTLTTKLVDDAVGTYGQFQLGATLVSTAGLTGFVEATATMGRDYQNYGGRMGVRLAF